MMGKVVHFEIPTDDPARASKFYKTVFGWQINTVPDIEYWMVYTSKVDKQYMPTEKGVINGGMMKRMGPVSSPVITVDVDDIDGAMKRIEKEGGKILGKKQKVMDMGWSAYFKDTEGNVMGLWQAQKKDM